MDLVFVGLGVRVSPEASGLALNVYRAMPVVKSPSLLARALGFRSRYGLNRALRRAGLPGPRDLVAWLQLLEWLLIAERRGRTLCAQALAAGLDPAPCYRTVRRLTGCSWKKLSARGFDWAASAFWDDCCNRMASACSTCGRRYRAGRPVHAASA